MSGKSSGVGIHLRYERRRNEHRNDGHSLDTVVTMPYLARCMTATALLRPHLAVKVNAPSRLLTQPALYEDVFASDIPLGAFHNAVRIMRRVEDHAHTSRPETDDEVHLGKTRRPALWYAQWHLAAYATMKVTGRAAPDVRCLAALTDGDIAALDLPGATVAVRYVLRDLKRMTRRNEYQCAKMPLSVERLMEAAAGGTGVSETETQPATTPSPR